MQLIVADIDGCISPEASVAWDLEKFARFAAFARDAAARRDGLPPLTLCTGRPQPYAEVLAKIFDIRLPIVCENGAVLYTLTDNRSRFGPGVTDAKIASLRAVRGFIETELFPKFPEAVYQFGKEAQLSVFSARPEIFVAMQEAIEAFVAREKHEPLIISPSHFYLNISMEGVNKGTTLRALFEELGVSGAEAAGIGDTVGDLPLREAVGFFACPANAQPEIKAVADYVSPFEDIAGMLDILEGPVRARL